MSRFCLPIIGIDFHTKIYEQLREYVLTGFTGNNFLSLGLLQRDGISAWLNRDISNLVLNNVNTDNMPECLPGIDENNSSMVYILANMIIACRNEVIL